MAKSSMFRGVLPKGYTYFVEVHYHVGGNSVVLETRDPAKALREAASYSDAKMIYIRNEYGSRIWDLGHGFGKGESK